MRLKKVILIILLLFAVASLLLIAYSAKNKMGMFGKFYDAHVKEQTVLAGKAVKSNLDSVFAEIKPLTDDSSVKSVFVSASLGENTDRYLDGVIKIKDSLKDCRKIQAFDIEGRVIFSTMEDEINTQKVKASIIQKIKEYFSSNTGLFVYFVDNNQFVAIYPMVRETTHGYVAVYYANQRLLKGLPNKKISLPYSFDNFMFLTPKTVDKNDMGKIVKYYSGAETKTTNTPAVNNQTIGGMAQFNGLKMVYFSKKDGFIPPWTLLILLLDLFLLVVVIFTLVQVFMEDKMYRKVNLSSFDRDVPAGTTARGEEIGGLVSDIEQNRSYNGATAEKGIEDMILTSNVRLTEEEKIPVQDDGKISLETGDVVELEEREKFELPDFDFQVDKPDSFKDRKGTELFAEQERILGGVDNKPFEEELTFETPSTLKETVPEPAAAGGGFESVEAPELQLSSDLEELENIKPASGGMDQEPGLDIKMVSEEEEGLKIKGEKFADTENLTISLGDEPGEANLQSRPMEDEIALTMDTSSINRDEGEKLKDITPVEDIELQMEELPTIPHDIPMPEPVEVFEEPEAIPETPTLSVEKTPAVVSLDAREKEYEAGMTNVFVEPPVRLSSICTVADYGKAAVDIAKKSLNINKVIVLERQRDGFKTVVNKGFGMKDFTLGKDDPIYKIFLSHKKSLDISGDLKKSRYLQERFSDKDIASAEEFFIMPIIRKDDVSGIAVFARDKGTTPPTNFQRSELFNLGFLQEN